MIDGLLLNIAGRLMTLAGNPAGIIGTPGMEAPPPQVGDVVTGANNIVQQQPAPAEGMGLMPIIIYAGVLLVAMYFLMFRGPRKREKKAREMQASIRTGDNVVVTGGMFGRIADVGEDCFIVEFGTNRGIRIPVLKTDVLGVREPKLTPPPKQDVITEKEKEKGKEKES